MTFSPSFRQNELNFSSVLKKAKEIVAEAWHLTVLHRNRLFRIGFIPSFFSILVTAWYLYYQIQSWRYSPWFNEEKNGDFLFGFLLEIWRIISQDITIVILAAILLVIVILGWFFTPMICRAAVIDLVGKSWRGEPMEKGVSNAVFHFFPLFKINAFQGLLQPTSFFTEFSFVARHIPQATTLVLPPLIFLGSIGLITLFFLPYATQSIMIKDRDFISAIKDSFKLVVENPGKTLKILLLFLLVELRVVLNVLIILALPLIIAGATGLFASFFSQQIGLILAIILIFLLIFIAAYLTGILFVFSEVIWTIAYLEFSGAERKSKEENRSFAKEDIFQDNSAAAIPSLHT